MQREIDSYSRSKERVEAVIRFTHLVGLEWGKKESELVMIRFYDTFVSHWLREMPVEHWGTINRFVRGLLFMSDRPTEQLAVSLFSYAYRR
jgi:hypothetical protein